MGACVFHQLTRQTGSLHSLRKEKNQSSKSKASVKVTGILEAWFKISELQTFVVVEWNHNRKSSPWHGGTYYLTIRKSDLVTFWICWFPHH